MVVVFGSINLDFVVRVSRLPAAGETVDGTSFSTAPGGKGANQALAARRAGAEVAMFGVVGGDAFADLAMRNLATAGVNMTGVTRAAAATGVALVTVDAHGENAITVVSGANATARAIDVPDHALTPSTTVLLQLEVPVPEVAALATRARQRGARVILNAAPAVALPTTLARDLALLIVNETEAAALGASWSLPPEAEPFIGALQSQWGLDAIVTLGARGAVMHDTTRCAFRHISPPTVRVLDTTGAGDALAGTVAAALDRGATLEDALVAGVGAGTIACTWPGAQAAVPPLPSTR